MLGTCFEQLLTAVSLLYQFSIVPLSLSSAAGYLHNERQHMNTIAFPD
jgi:hypothetical protein